MNPRYLSIATLVLASVACGSDPDPVTPPGTAGTNAGGTAAGSMSGGAGGAAAGTGGAGSGGVAGGGSGGAAAGSGGTGGAFDPMPTMLSQTGLFSDMKAQTLAPGVFPFEPKYALWSDSATKRRWVYMPPGGKITTDASARGMEYWEYPTGFKLWKEFSRDGVLIETRLLLKKGDGVTNWYMVAFKWNADHSEAVAVPDGEMNAMGTQHDIPAQKGCTGCHTAMNDNVLGFTALQLSHNNPGMNLALADQMGWFTKSPAAGGYPLPGTEAEQKALGYLHANCGMCHNDYGKVYTSGTSLDLWTHLDQLQSVQQTFAYLSMVCDQWPVGPVPGMHTKMNPITSCETGHGTGTPMDTEISSKLKRIVPKDPASGAVHDLMALRVAGDATTQMPPLGTEMVDPTGLADVDAWINALPAE